MYAPSTRAPEFIKEISLQLKLHIEPQTLIVVTLITYFISRQNFQTKNKQKMLELTDIINQADLTDICTAFTRTQKKIPSSL